jgi:hypothetical protein
MGAGREVRADEVPTRERFQMIPVHLGAARIRSAAVNPCRAQSVRGQLLQVNIARSTPHLCLRRGPRSQQPVIHQSR